MSRSLRLQRRPVNSTFTIGYRWQTGQTVYTGPCRDYR